MGFKCSMLALSPRIPREDMTTHQEGGVEAAAQYLQGRWPEQWQWDRTATLDEGFNPSDNSLWVGTWGETVVLTGDHILDLIHDQPVEGEWMLMVHSVVDACSYRTPPSHGGRVVDLNADSTVEDKRDALSGARLPFEEPYARGDHDEDPEDFEDFEDFDDGADSAQEGGFHPLSLADSAALWIFGTIGETPPRDEVSSSIVPIMPWEIPLHRFVPVTSAPHQVPQPKKRGLFARLMGQ